MSNAGYADRLDSSVYDLLMAHCPKDDMLHLLMEYFKHASTENICTELAEWVHADNECITVDLSSWGIADE